VQEILKVKEVEIHVERSRRIGMIRVVRKIQVQEDVGGLEGPRGNDKFLG
jgi:hypothetical protein